MSTDLQKTYRHLPAALPRQAERLGYQLLSALDRAGFTRTNADGTTWSVCFADAGVYTYNGLTLARFVVDTERLYHTLSTDLIKPPLLAHLSTVTRHEVRATTAEGLSYMVLLQGAPANTTKLPKSAPLDLSTCKPLTVPLGVGASGHTTAKLDKIGHALLVGMTGAGKSSWLQAALVSLATTTPPDRLHLALVDPKRAELGLWQGLPHLYRKVAHDVDAAAEVLLSVVDELHRRSELISGARCRDLTAYNRQAADPLPWLLVVVDELLDLVDDRDITDALKAIARTGRYAGIYCWLATQHATALAGLPRVVTANCTTRFAFRVADRYAADAAGCPGAENLPKSPGRYLARIAGDTATELQGYHVDDGTLDRITKELCTDPDDADTGPRLTADELLLVRYAAEHLGGRFSINKLAAAVDGWTNHQVNHLARSWAARGWLTETPQGRICTPALLGLVDDDDLTE